MLLLLRKYASTYIHPFPSPKPPKNILLLIRERIAKNISVFPCEINARVILVTTTCYIISRDECSKKRKKRKIRGNKKGKVPGTSKEKKKVRREVKMDKCPTVELGVTRYPSERKEKENIEPLILPESFKRARKVCIPSKEHK